MKLKQINTVKRVFRAELYGIQKKFSDVCITAVNGWTEAYDDGDDWNTFAARCFGEGNDHLIESLRLSGCSNAAQYKMMIYRALKMRTVYKSKLKTLTALHNAYLKKFPAKPKSGKASKAKAAKPVEYNVKALQKFIVANGFGKATAAKMLKADFIDGFVKAANS